MKTFKIKARSMSGSTIEEIIVAESEFDANQMAAERGLFVTNIKEVKDRQKSKMLNVKELIMFNQLMGAMLQAGVKVDKALDLSRRRADSKKTSEIYGMLYEEIQKGTSMSEAMRMTGAFPQLLVNMISSADETGNIGEVFNSMAEFYEKEAALNRKVKSAMIYPTILAVMTVAVVIILTVFVLPGIMESFDNAELPFLTKMLMGFSDFLISSWYLIIGGIVGLVFGIRELLTYPEYKIKFDKMKLSVPIAGKLLRTIYSARAASTISSLYQNGVNMLVIIKETGGTIGNDYIDTLFDDVYIKVSTGEQLSTALEETGVFDPMLYSMLKVWEEAGDSGQILASTANFFNNEAEAATEQLVQLLEPLFLIIMGVVIGAMVMAIMQPMLSMYDSL